MTNPREGMKMDYDERWNRLRAMVDDDGQTWDLSPNDKAAIQYALDALAAAPAQALPDRSCPGCGTPEGSAHGSECPWVTTAPSIYVAAEPSPPAAQDSAADLSPAALDAERLLDNAATCSQVRGLLRDNNKNETPLRECVRLNVIKPYEAALAGLRQGWAEDVESLIAERAERDHLRQSDREANLAWRESALECTRLREALQRIANNTCCPRCQEAAIVARAALSGGER